MSQTEYRRYWLQRQELVVTPLPQGQQRVQMRFQKSEFGGQRGGGGGNKNTSSKNVGSFITHCINDEGHESGIEPINRGKASEQGICHALRY